MINVRRSKSMKIGWGAVSVGAIGGVRNPASWRAHETLRVPDLNERPPINLQTGQSLADWPSMATTEAQNLHGSTQA